MPEECGRETRAGGEPSPPPLFCKDRFGLTVRMGIKREESISMNFSMCIVATHTWIARAACLAFVGLTVAAQGQQFLIAPTYATQSSYQSDGGVNSVATADFNGDGKIDVAAVRYGGRTVSVLLGNGNGTFQESVDYACGDSATAVITADFNLDGKPDIAPSSFCQSGRRAASVGQTVGH